MLVEFFGTMIPVMNSTMHNKFILECITFADICVIYIIICFRNLVVNCSKVR